MAGIPAAERTSAEAASLRLAFLESLEQVSGSPKREQGIEPTNDPSLADALGYLKQLHQAQLTAQKKLDEAIRNSPTTMVMQEAGTKHTRVRLAGVFDSLGQKVETNVPDFLPPLQCGDSSPLSSTNDPDVEKGYRDTTTPDNQKPRPVGALKNSESKSSDRSEDSKDRLTLARWLMHPGHPLTARVAVNRVWQTLWGRGFVDSPENFGTQCGEPLHADLLDWLATECVRLDWDTKALIKLIVTSRTYGRRSEATAEMWQRDPQNRYLARGPRFRLPVHAVRDSALLLSGRLDRTVGGPPVIVDEVIGQNGNPVKLPLEKHDRRRTLYTFWKRNSPHPMLAVFDVADRNQCEVRTMRTNTPLQALVTLNERGFVAAAEDLGQRARQVSDNEALQLGWAWQACTGRRPEVDELKKLQSTLRDYRQMSDENEAEAWTAVCNVLLNLDATMTLE